jgi:hypothetical protein
MIVIKLLGLVCANDIYSLVSRIAHIHSFGTYHEAYESKALLLEAPLDTCSASSWTESLSHASQWRLPYPKGK